MSTYYTTRVVYEDGRESTCLDLYPGLASAILGAQTEAETFKLSPELGIAAVKIDRCEWLETVQTIPVTEPVAP